MIFLWSAGLEELEAKCLAKDRGGSALHDSRFF